MSVVGVRFRRAGKPYYFDAGDWPDLEIGDWVVVDTTRGPEVGKVVIGPVESVATDVGELRPLLRRATWRELSEWASHRAKEPAALQTAREHVARLGLPMRPVCAEYNFDGSQLTVYFVTEEQRVDFRLLVRELSRALHTRVHLHQIGSRDWAKLVGGFERCGQTLCCATWLADFQPISIRMAKRQNLPLNPSEISGVCGKLLCCLAYEDQLYGELRVGLPKVGTWLSTGTGRGKILDVNVLTRQVTILWEGGTRAVMDADCLAAELGRAGTSAEATAEPAENGGDAGEP